ncbi:MAG: hypothetical protein KAI66_25505, partial [Lentisphaeria bacterium]|nr:hypothetical protein [Lentisphaeria bacterium]
MENLEFEMRAKGGTLYLFDSLGFLVRLDSSQFTLVYLDQTFGSAISAFRSGVSLLQGASMPCPQCALFSTKASVPQLLAERAL